MRETDRGNRSQLKKNAYDEKQCEKKGARQHSGCFCFLDEGGLSISVPLPAAFHLKQTRVENSIL